MTRLASEVLIGPGTLYTAPYGTAFPLDPSVTPAGTWVEIGYSEEGWSFNVENTQEDVEVAEELDPIDILRTKRDVHVVGVAAQANLENIKTALGSGTIATSAGPPAVKTYTPGDTDALTKLAVLLRVSAPTVAGAAKVRDIKIPRAIPVSAVELSYKKAPDKASIAVDFRVVKEAGVALFTIVDLT